MAIKTIRTDDLNGTEGATNHSFSVDGRSWSIDLTPENFMALQDALAPFTKVATKKTSAASKTPSDTRKVRAWAEANGHLKEGSRGRIPAAVQDAYNAAH